MNSNTVFLLDLDDTLFNTEQYKTDLFNKIGHVINPTGVAAQGGAEIAAIYNLYRQNNPVYNPNEFAQFLSSTFGYEAEIRDCFETDYTQYVLPEAAELVKQLAKQGRVIIWTAGSYPDQAAKLTKSGLLLPGKNNSNIVDASVLTQDVNPLFRPAPIAIVDSRKEQEPREQLKFFLENLPENEIVVIDNQAGLIKQVVEMNNSRLKGVWVDQGEQKDKESAQELRTNLPPQVESFASTAEFKQYLTKETFTPEQKG
ncbi:hypothetical protein A2313_00585 [Candidatus Roizmanbacteria bacterium RIFOXYB2_FULL_41_10]|uniref:Uncharacterized protein n=1 Tax=Candidatus Roizmanbacteria bacterium RIFOXYA1_FULL_41_12 TaxID=1802082 RepID=A0A1F7KAJ1_9BACT|nr:MAG: hypothetical protein A2209_04135 [Candidatus Roizmanbacteria bacterium RIFOXYA1_FULL_41_12]OGK66876.1 MAG: hypothetical protein A2377_03190 [Candidatus Roizmanbacteria bacterium RIFOXYB1_FULL_41_27]OGK68868.1 MAG: hypothetical protein A2262_00580 [Candidatus Roizmanbacteria bacterium RIFOXYA2_FULL_41_8]OGK70750.1 MAG: hypothetical protein A2403_01515 [Candidatus Roizmanbacteria bacterium RIFOXYC1_FULL_41_16]OGK71458.1 MAG: hypothetical protein A2313_00585 [Candidatus Roizmanbacteria bac